MSNRFCASSKLPSSSTNKSKRRSPFFYLFLLFVLTGGLMVIVVFERATKTPTHIPMVQSEEVGDDAWFIKQNEIKKEKLRAADAAKANSMQVRPLFVRCSSVVRPLFVADLNLLHFHKLHP
ncbi:hypothetical protein TrLO_g951 [Triparma laevis f. longispina]|uniref:Uncharacterized protein n=1 Tax=Triparma laevis f. longispina TaxID=1714387 RepID=A0A9W7FKT6_9STRA|nr:hypothetical protein TrLO_g951 [Triparma laevis f. longispina]